MKKIVLLLALGLGLAFTGKTQDLTGPPSRLALKVEGSDRKVGLGVQYTIRQQWVFPVVAGLGKEFQEGKWNDWYMEFWPHYLFGRKKWRFPLGMITGIRFMKDYGYHFPAFYGGAAGGVLYQLSCHGIGITAGAKYGKRLHLLRHTEEWGKVEARETYREKPFFFTVYYQFSF